MADVFVSYSRRDLGFVQRLAGDLTARGKDVWVDVEGIRDAEVFPQALQRAIESSDAFVFVISPDAVRSEFCEQEVAHAAELNKRIVPLAWRQVPDAEIPEAIRFRNWIPAGDLDDQLDATIDRLVAAIDTDLEWERHHTRLTVKALEWDHAGRDRSFLIRGSELAGADQWLAAGAGKDPGPSALEQAYLLTARRATAQRQRTLLAISATVTAIAVGLLIFALISRGQAVRTQTIEKSQALAAESETELSADPELSILLAMQAVRTSPTPQAMYALREAIDQSPVIRALPTRGTQSCGGASLGDATPPGVAFSPSGALIAEAACDGTVVVVDDATGRVRARWRLGRAAAPLAFSPDGRTLAVGTGAGVAMLGVATGRLIAMLHPESDATLPDGGAGAWPGESALCAQPGASIPQELAFSPDGGRLAAAYSFNLDVWPVDGVGRRQVVGGPGGCVTGIGFGRSGASVLVADGGSVDVVDPRTGEVRRRHALLPTVGADDAWDPVLTGLAVSPDGRDVAVAAQLPGNVGSVELYDAATWQPVATLFRRAGVPVYSIAFSPDGSRLAIGAEDGSAGIWSVASHHQELALSGQMAGITAVAWRPDGREIATSAADGTGRVWRTSLAQGTTIATGGGPWLTHAVAVSGNRVWGAISTPAAESVRSWTLAGRRSSSLTAPGNDTPSPLAPAFSANGRLVAIPEDGQTVVIRNLADGRTVGTESALGPAPVNSLALDSSGDRLAEASGSGAIALFEVNGAMTQLASSTLPTCPAGGLGEVAFSADGRRVVAIDYCGRGIVWDARTGEQVDRFDTGVQAVSAVSLDTDGRRVAVASSARTTTIFDLEDNRTLRVLGDETAPVTGVAFNPQGTWVATASEDGNVRIWNAANGEPLRLLSDSAEVNGVSFTPHGTDLVTTDTAGLIHIQDACSLCGNAPGLLRLASSRVTRQLTPAERREYGA